MPISLRTQKDSDGLHLIFSERIVSTNISELKEQCFEFLNENSETSTDSDKLILNFENTLLIDSLGLNLLVSIIQWAEEHYLKIHAYIGHEIVHNTLESVWLTQKMTIHRTEDE